MAHNLVVGMTESGKSTLAKIVCKAMQKRGISTAVLDPMHSQDWGVPTFQTHNSETFLEYVKKNKSHVLFIDEAGQMIGRWNQPMEWLATTSRHLGHSCWFILQGTTQVSPVIRDQCHKCYLFACDVRIIDSISIGFNSPKLRELDTPEKLNFYAVSRFKSLQKGRVDFDPLNLYIEDVPTEIPSKTRENNDETNDSNAGVDDDRSDVDDGLRDVGDGKSTDDHTGTNIDSNRKRIKRNSKKQSDSD